MNKSEIEIDRVKKLLKDYECNIPDIPKQSLISLFSNIQETNKDNLNVMFVVIVTFLEGRYIHLFGEVAKDSIRFKREKKLYLLNLILDVLHYLGATRYIEIAEDKIIIEIIDDTILKALLAIKKEALDKSYELSKDIQAIRDYYTSLDSYKEWQKQNV